MAWSIRGVDFMAVDDYCRIFREKYNSIPDILVSDIEKLLGKAGRTREEKKACTDIVLETLEKSSHVTRARSVAFMAAFCRYLARLVEGYGVSPFYSGVMPGKGRGVHQVLALASNILFERFYLKSAGVSIDKEIEKSVDEAMRTVFGEVGEAGRQTPIRMYEVIAEEKAEELKRVSSMAQSMLRNLVNILQGDVKNRMGLSLERLEPLAETQLVDYSLKVIGTPDLVLEDPEKRRAIVVEWKTYEESVAPWEMAQAYVYALIELRRLGYGENLGISRVNLRELVDAFAAKDPATVPVVPLVIRPYKSMKTGYYTTHPALASDERKADPCAVFHLLTLSALHLSMLHSYVRGESDECKVDAKSLGLAGYIGGDKKVAVYRVTPPTLRNKLVRARAKFPKPFAGTPGETSRYPCKVCARIFYDASIACPKYFAKSDETPLEKIVHSIRMRILKQHENDMGIYKHLYETTPYSLEKREMTNQRNYIEVEGTRYYYNFFDEMIVGDWGLELIKYNPSTLVTTENLDMFGPDATVYTASTIRTHKAITIYLVERPGEFMRPITLNPAVFARAEDIDIDIKGNKLRVALSPPSETHRFSLKLFSYYLRRLGCRDTSDGVYCEEKLLKDKGLRILAVETLVDLTHYDLRVLDLVYRNLIFSEEDPGEDVKNLLADVDSYRGKFMDSIFGGFHESFPTERGRNRR